MAKNLIIVAGPNGAGKTTFARDYLQEHHYSFLSADDLARKLSPEKPEMARIAAGREFSAQLNNTLQSGASLVVESTLSGLSIQRTFREAKQEGYTISIVFIFLESPQACVHRVRERVENGGHDVPEADIRRRFFRSKANFWSLYRNEADSWFLFYNSGAVFQLVAFGDTAGYEITDEESFDIFLKDIGSDEQDEA